MATSGNFEACDPEIGVVPAKLDKVKIKIEAPPTKPVVAKYAMLREDNSSEGETWLFFFKVDPTNTKFRQSLDKFRRRLPSLDGICGEYTLTTRLKTKAQIKKLISKDFQDADPSYLGLVNFITLT